MLDLLFGLPMRIWGLLSLVVFVPVLVGLVGLVVTRKWALGIATRLASRAVVVMGLGFGVLVIVATLAVVSTGLQELRRRHMPVVVDLATRLATQHQRSPQTTSIPRELSLFRALQPEARVAVAWGSNCRERCLGIAADPGSSAGVLAWVLSEVRHPPDASSLHTVTIEGELHLVIPAVMRDPAGRPTGHLLVAMRAGRVADQALRTAGVLVALAYALLLSVWWFTRRTVSATVARRVKETANRVRAADTGQLLLDTPKPDVRDELAVLERAVHSHIVESVARLREADRHTADARALAARMESTATLAAGVAHDFNNLMTGVMANAELLKYDLAQNPEAGETLGTIIECANRGGQLAQQLLAFARGGRYQPTLVDLNALAQDTARVEAHTVPANVTVATALADDPITLEADPIQLGQVLANLHRNAVEALQATGGGRITVSTRRILADAERPAALADLPSGEYVVLSVADTGPGMTEETRARIFEPFFTTKEGGRGMGLAATYGIVTHHGGQIEVLSEPGAGTVFNVYLPATASGRPPRAQPEPIGDTRPTVLFVDDEVAILSATRRLLEASGYRVLLAENGAEGIQIARNATGSIDVVLLDMRMPGMSGAEAFDPIRQARPDAKVIVCSGYELDPGTRSILDRGATAFVQKPFRIETLIAEIQRALGSTERAAT